MSSDYDPYTAWDPEEATPASDGNPDTAIVPYVEALREAGVDTYQSCAGHVRDDGTKSDGVLWLGPETLSPEDARALGAQDSGVLSACRRYVREECWEVTFCGMADGESGEETLRWAMGSLFDVLGVDPP